jgi:hypothetical protein
MPTGVLTGVQHMRSLSPQPRHPAAHRLALRHRRVRCCGVGAGLVEDIPGQGAGVGVIPVCARRRRGDLGINRLGRSQGFPATVDCGTVKLLSPSGIQSRSSL